MSPLAPNLFQRRFGNLMEIGRARLPELAPEWTDHNAHDPGITLMELLAWVAEAQLYSLSRMRRDERTAYAALLGISNSGTQGSNGLIWPDPLDPNSPAKTYSRTMVIPENAVANVTGSDTPAFRPSHKLLWVPGEIQQLETRSTRGRRTDHTVTNAHGGVPFMPFGERAGRRDVLAMTFSCRDRLGLFGSAGQDSRGALWPIGVRVAPPAGGAAQTGQSEKPGKRTSLTATLVTDDRRVPLRIASDSTAGFLTTGAILLDLDAVAASAGAAGAGGSPGKFTLELRSPGGFARPPRILQIEPNVIPIEQGRKVPNEAYDSNGSPDLRFKLQSSGLQFRSGEEPVSVDVKEPAETKNWSRTDRLIEHGPDEEVYTFDFTTGEIAFGNGINGRIPPPDSKIFVTYSVSDGEEGNVARGRKWQVLGFEGALGINPDLIAGGTGASGWDEQRREARRRSREDHALVSSTDIAAAARALTLLEVARAWVVAPGTSTPRAGIVTLVALRSRPDENEPEQSPETASWLNAIRRHLAPRMLLGTRLEVTAPRYREFTIHAVLETEPGRKPAAVEEEVRKQLRRRLALVESVSGVEPRQPGVPVTVRDVGAWIRATGVVTRVVQLELRGADGKVIEEKKVNVPRNGLPRWIADRSTIDVQRPEKGRAR